MSLKAIDRTKTTQVPATGATHPQTNISRGSGRREVAYRDARGKTFSAVVIAPGSSSGLMLEIHAFRRGGQSHIIDNVPLATTMKSTGAYFNTIN